MFGEEGPRERREVLDRLVLRIGPPRRELEAVRRLATLAWPLAFFDVLVARGVRVVLGQRAIGDHEQLHVFE